MGRFDLEELLSGMDDEATDAEQPDAQTPDDGGTPDGHPPVGDGVEADVPSSFHTENEAGEPHDESGKSTQTMADSHSESDDQWRAFTPQDEALHMLYVPEPGSAVPPEQLTDALFKRGVLNSEQSAAVARVMKQTPGRRVEDIAIEMGIDEAEIQTVVAELCGLPFERIDLDDSEAVEYKYLKRLGAEFCKQELVMPLRKEGRRLVIGTSRPDDVFLLDDVRRRLNVQSIRHVLVTAYDIRGVLETMTEEEHEEYNVEELLSDVDEDDVELVKEEKHDSADDDAESSPVVKYVNHIIQSAVKEGASDIHIEPDERTLKVRFRIDGILFEMMNPPRKMHSALVSRLKIMANLDIAERRMPQDGRIRVTVMGRKLDLRVSTVPTPKGEKAVMRILDTRSINVTLDELGFSPDTLELWKKQINQPHGIILVTGPTGSGKTTTLYSSMRQLDLRKLNVSTVEDPVEYNLSGVTQIQTHERIGMTFAKALKALLRQDPDVVMVGEVRDLDTATIAIQAALTGHLVLSTLHTNDAPSSVTRLVNIGIEPFLVGAALNAVLAQRLARRICDHCASDVPVKEELKEFLELHGVSIETVKQGQGCSRCRETGYQGRIGLYELLVLDDFLRDKIAGSPNVTEFRRTCCERGMVSLREDGFDKVRNGLTSVEEIMRVTQATI